MWSDGVFAVEFAVDERSGLRFPAKMTERYSPPSEVVNATAQVQQRAAVQRLDQRDAAKAARLGASQRRVAT